MGHQHQMFTQSPLGQLVYITHLKNHNSKVATRTSLKECFYILWNKREEGGRRKKQDIHANPRGRKCENQSGSRICVFRELQQPGSNVHWWERYQALRKLDHYLSVWEIVTEPTAASVSKMSSSSGGWWQGGKAPSTVPGLQQKSLSLTEQWFQVAVTEVTGILLTVTRAAILHSDSQPSVP